MSNNRSSKGNERMHDRDMVENAFARWSRRKAAARTGSKDATSVCEDTEIAQPAPLGTDRISKPTSVAVCEIEPAAEPLADPERLDISADFTVFLRDGVAAELRRTALRRLWTLDPVFSHQDGLVEYGEDFTDSAKAGMAVRTGYRIVSDLARRAESASSPLAGDAPTAVESEGPVATSESCDKPQAAEDASAANAVQNHEPHSDEAIASAVAPVPHDRGGRR